MPRLFRSFAALAAALSLASVDSSLVGAPPTDPGPRLAIVISIDQCRGDFLGRFQPYFVADGFRRLIEAGAVYEDCHMRHAVTKTAPGHAALLSGVYGNVHGIVANDWLDRSSWKPTPAVFDPNAPLVGLPAGTPVDPRAGRSPRNFRATTVGDQLKPGCRTATFLKPHLRSAPRHAHLC